MSDLHFFAVYSGHPKSRGHICIARTVGPREAVKAARNLGLSLTRTAYARRLSLSQYAEILRSYTGSDKIVTAERIECWQEALKGDPACRTKKADDLCAGCDCWKATRRNCS